MSLTTIVGALLAVVARPKRGPQERPPSFVCPRCGAESFNPNDIAQRYCGRCRVFVDDPQEVERLTRSHARLVDHIERLERELALTQELLAHWRGEAARLARENREERDRREGQRAYQRVQQALMQQYDAAQAQQAQAADLTQYIGAMTQHAQQMQTFDGFCNCVPSRAQVWGAQHGLVQQLNDNMVKE